MHGRAPVYQLSRGDQKIGLCAKVLVEIAVARRMCIGDLEGPWDPNAVGHQPCSLLGARAAAPKTRAGSGPGVGAVVGLLIHHVDCQRLGHVRVCEGYVYRPSLWLSTSRFITSCNQPACDDRR